MMPTFVIIEFVVLFTGLLCLVFGGLSQLQRHRRRYSRGWIA